MKALKDTVKKLMPPKLIKKPNPKKFSGHIAIAGNPNVGKSTVFNAITGLHQHTGNWPGKTVECAEGHYKFDNKHFKLTDIPGTYSLTSNSQEEEIARDFICFSKLDTVIVVLDATCLERNLNLALQILEITQNVVICINFIDEAQKKQIYINLDELSLQLGGVPIIYTNARKKFGIKNLLQSIGDTIHHKNKVFYVKNNSYPNFFTDSVKNIADVLSKKMPNHINTRWLAEKILEGDLKISDSIKTNTSIDISENEEIRNVINTELDNLKNHNLTGEKIKEMLANNITKKSESIYKLCVHVENKNHDKKDRIIDNILTSKLTGFPIMAALLVLIFWITIVGANYPSQLISKILFQIHDNLIDLFININCPKWIYGILVEGIYKTLAWVVSVMLPPMAIFFPLFTFLEDVGYLPRIAFNLDNTFRKCGAHGKQALTTCMGFGCNACGIIGCRIIDSPREKLIAILTNNFVPCNGRLPQFNYRKKDAAKAPFLLQQKYLKHQFTIDK